MNIDSVNGSTEYASRISSSSSSGSNNFFSAMADAWGKTLDRQAGKLQNLANEIGNEGKDMPSKLNELSAEAMRMNFLSQSASNSLKSVGNALETMARKG